MPELFYFDKLVSYIKQRFEQNPDSRTAFNRTKPLSDALLSAFAVFLLKGRSLLQFIHRLRDRSMNLQKIFKISTVMSDTAVRQIITDQIQLKVSLQFHLALAQEKRLIRLWEKLREVFDLVQCDSMETIYTTNECLQERFGALPCERKHYQATPPWTLFRLLLLIMLKRPVNFLNCSMGTPMPRCTPYTQEKTHHRETRYRSGAEWNTTA